MVLKLMKHEFKYLGRYLFLIWVGILLSVFSMRLLWELRFSPNTILAILGRASLGLMVVGLIGLNMVTFFTIIFHFYRSMFSNEGYLTFTLPVKTSQIIFSKLFVGWTFLMGSLLISSLVGATYITEAEVWGAFASGLEELFQNQKIVVYYLVLWLLIYVVGTMAQILEFYMAMSLGQLANRNKVIISILFYIGIRIIVQISVTTLMVVLTLSGYMDRMEVAPGETILQFLTGGLIFVVLYGIVEWLIVNYLCDKKLNLQ